MNLLNRIRAVLFAFLFSFWGKSVTAQTYFPPVNTNQWDTLSSDRLQFCPDRIDSLYKFLEVSNSKAFILLKDGKLYWNATLDALPKILFAMWPCLKTDKKRSNLS